jgi:hypothetical protein
MNSGPWFCGNGSQVSLNLEYCHPAASSIVGILRHIFVNP